MENVWLWKGLGFLALCGAVWALRRAIKRWDPPGDETTDVGVRKGMTLALYVAAAYATMAILGIPISALAVAISGMLAGLSFAARDFIGNLLGAVMLFTDRPISLNDRIKIGGREGRVVDIGTRRVKLETDDGNSVTIPNKAFMNDILEVLK